MKQVERVSEEYRKKGKKTKKVREVVHLWVDGSHLHIYMQNNSISSKISLKEKNGQIWKEK